MPRQYDGVTADINRMSGPAFRDWWQRFTKLTQSENRDNQAALALSGELAEAIITEWPVEAEINAENYLRLGVLDMVDVDHALEQEIAIIIKKKLERPSILADDIKPV